MSTHDHDHHHDHQVVLLPPADYLRMSYYEKWLTRNLELLAALERLVTAKGLSDPNEMLARKEAWANAYRHTPHGKPVDLPNGSS
jgi:Nitrile hydratase beta subunit